MLASSPSRLHRPLHSLSSFFPRNLHTAPRLSKSPAIVQDSLEKTLEEHRAANRAGLIRKVPYPENNTEQLPLNTNPPSTPPTYKKHKPHAKKRPRKPSPKPEPQSALSAQLKWHQAKNRRPLKADWIRCLDSDSQYSDGIALLAAEIRALDEYTAITSAEQKVVDSIVADLASLLEGTVPQAPLITGSRRTALAMTHSDLHIMLPVSDPARSADKLRQPSATRPQILDTYSDLLRRAESIIGQSTSFSHLVPFYERKMPLLTAAHVPSGLQIRLSCGESLPPSVEYINDYHAEYPSARPLYIVMRLILESQGLFGSHKSSIGSESLFLLVVVFLKMNHGRFKSSDSLVEQLLGVLKLYGTEVNLTTTGVSVDPPSFFAGDTIKESLQEYNSEEDQLPSHIRGQRALVKAKRNASMRRNASAAERLCLQDPTNHLTDLGITCTRTREIQSAFALAHGQIKDSLDNWVAGDTTRPVKSILESAIKADFGDYERLRDRIISVGKSPQP